MTDRQVAAGKPARPGWTEVARWPLWSLPRPALVFIAATIVLSHAGMVVGLFFVHGLSLRVLGLGALLTALGMIHTEVLVGFERLRVRTSDAHPATVGHTDLTSVWTFALVLLLPIPVAMALIFLFHIHLWLRVNRPAGGLAYRGSFTRATMLLSCVGAGATLHGLGVSIVDGRGDLVTFVAIALVGAIYTVINTALLTAGMVLALPGTSPWKVFSLDDHLLEVTVLGVGALMAAVLAGPFPWVGALVLPVLLMLHRATSAQELERDADLDLATGLLNGAAWHREARRELRRARRRQQSVGLLLIDIDSFRLVNETYGHLTGNEVLAAIGRELFGAARVHDVVGRHGGEEFVVLLPAVEDELLAVAGRLRDSIARMSSAQTEQDQVQSNPGLAAAVVGLTASIGGARFPDDGFGVEELLTAADRALRDAKRAGTGQIMLRSVPTGMDGLAGYRRARTRAS